MEPQQVLAALPALQRNGTRYDFYRRTCQMLGAYVVDAHIEVQFIRSGCVCLDWLECSHSAETLKALRLLRKNKKGDRWLRCTDVV